MERMFRLRQDGETFHAVERDGELRRATGDLVGGFSAGAPVRGGLSAATLLPPVTPSKIVCVGLNYKDHAAEQGKPLPAEPLIFIKPSTAVIGPGDPIKLPPGVGRVDYEAELGLVIGRRAHRVAKAQAWDYIAGLICVNDVTARDLQKKESSYTRCKGFDTFAPIGPCVAIGGNGHGGEPRAVEGWVNGQRRQASTTAHLIFSIEYIVEFITFVMTLEPGDIIATGTPAGIGPLANGDTVTVNVEGVGELTNPVKSEV
jgi:2-keto-4-pentenoate hydratase/2-oxohepta-3-ene-1,7-dioic acid hydratase in catechol pathway